jgi:hypothetical protein
MFDLRYHVASLAAVFLALVIGILVGVGISSGGFVQKSERRILNDKIDELQRSLDAARLRTGDLSRTQRGATTYVEESYPLLMADRLASRRVAPSFRRAWWTQSSGTSSSARSSTREQAMTLRLRALRPSTPKRWTTCSTTGGPGAVRAAGGLRGVGQRPRTGLVREGGTCGGFGAQLVEGARQRRAAADAEVIARSVATQQGPRQAAAGFGEGLPRAASWGGRQTSQVAALPGRVDKASLSSVDFVDTHVGRLALRAAGRTARSYGLSSGDVASLRRSSRSSHPCRTSGERRTDDPHRGSRRGADRRTIAALRREPLTPS